MSPSKVLAAEEEEEDNFTTMPNYRWKNQTTTDSDVEEEIIGSQYFINNTNPNNDVQKFEKSRKLNSRDFYFESRFALDIGSNVEAGEYWTDVKGNISNFDDGSTEDWEEGVNIDFFGVAAHLGGYWLRVRGDPGLATINATGLNVDASRFTRFVFQFMAYRDNITRIRIFDSANNLLVTDNTLYLEDNYYIFNESISDANWTGNETEIRIELQGDVGEPGFYVNYTYLEAEMWSENDGFKFSLLNADDEEGMAFQFTRDSVDFSYNISIDMFNSSGVALDYDYSFNYSLANDGWLHIKVDWHLDKKKVRVLLEFENGTDIVNFRKITELYGSNLGFPVLLLLEPGFPSLCLNNSVGAYARSLVYIDYIDADWRLIDWTEPNEIYWPIYQSVTNVTFEQEEKNNYTSIGPYGFQVLELSRNLTSHYYRLPITRFDGVAFNVGIDTDNLDMGDKAWFYADLWNVQENGTLYPVFEIMLNSYGNPITAFSLYGGPAVADLIAFKQFVGNEDIDAQFSTFVDADNKIATFQSEINSEGSEISRTATKEFNYTDEWLLVIVYIYETINGGAADDFIDVSVTGFEIARKDIIRDVVMAILSPILAGLMFLMSPFIILFQLLTSTIVKALQNLAATLKPFFDSLGEIFTAAIGQISGWLAALGVTITDAIGQISGWLTALGTTITDAIGGIAASIWSSIGEALNFISDFIWPALQSVIGDILNWVFSALSLIFGTVFGFIAGLVFWIWAELNLPDVLSWIEFALDYFTGFVTWALTTATAIVTFLFSISWMFLVGWWVYAVPVQWARSGADPLGGLGNFIDAYFKSIIPIEIFGCKIIIPQGIVFTLWLIAILPADFALFTAMSS